MFFDLWTLVSGTGFCLFSLTDREGLFRVVSVQCAGKYFLFHIHWAMVLLRDGTLFVEDGTMGTNF